jgi:hypothetical protein
MCDIVDIHKPICSHCILGPLRLILLHLSVKVESFFSFPFVPATQNKISNRGDKNNPQNINNVENGRKTCCNIPFSEIFKTELRFSFYKKYVRTGAAQSV